MKTKIKFKISNQRGGYGIEKYIDDEYDSTIFCSDGFHTIHGSYLKESKALEVIKQLNKEFGKET